MTTPTVTLAVFSGEKTPGWVLYYSGIKQVTVTSKQRIAHLPLRLYVEDALKHLNDAEVELKIRAILGRTGRRISLEGIPLPDHLTEAHDAPPGFSREVVEYLFDRAHVSTPASPPRPKKSFIPVPQSEGIDGEGESVGPGTIVVCSDASIRSISKTHKSLRVGTGWVIGYHDDGERVLVGHRTYPSMARHQTDLMEMHGVHDALTHLASAEEIHEGVERAALYCDNVGVVRALLDGFASKNLSKMIPPILEVVASLPFEVEFFWARGHSQNRWNLMADKMASLGSSQIYEQHQPSPALAESLT